MANSIDNISKYATSFIGFDEPSGNAMDSIGGYTGTLYNSPTRVMGWNGKGNAMSFNGSNQYVQFNDKVIPIGEKSIRFKFLKISPSLSYLMSNAHVTASTHGDDITIRANGTLGWASLRATSGLNRFYLESQINICDGLWHDILLTWDGTTNVDGVKMYIDDMLTPHVTTTANITETVIQSNNLTVGRASGGTNYYYFNGQLDQIEIYDRVISPIPDKYLVLHNSQYKYHDSISWKTTTATEENFIQYGMSQLSQITEVQWQELSGDKKLVMWSDFEDKKWMSPVYKKEPYIVSDTLGSNFNFIYYTENTSAENIDLILTDNYTPLDELDGDFTVITWSDKDEDKNLTLKVLPSSTTAYANGDISLVGVETIESVKLVGKGSPKIAMSYDNGFSYIKFDGSQWVTITDISQGMSIVEFNNLTNTQLMEGKGDSNYIRFAYFLSGEDEIDNIQLRVSMAGREDLAKQSDYTMSYDSTTKTITFNIKKDGTFSINYVDTRE